MVEVGNVISDFEWEPGCVKLDKSVAPEHGKSNLREVRKKMKGITIDRLAWGIFFYSNVNIQKEKSLGVPRKLFRKSVFD